MSRPADLLRLVQFPAGVTDFKTAMGINQWWEHLEQGKLFLLTNFADAAYRFGTCIKAALLSEHARAVPADIKKNSARWTTDFPTKAWTEFWGPNQTKLALHQEPMQLVKAACAIVALERRIMARADLAADVKADHVEQIYRTVRIVPAFYRLEGLDYDQMSDAQKLECAQALLSDCAIPIADGNKVLADLRMGQHVTRPVADTLARVLNLQVVTARRAGGGTGMGNVKPASKNLRQP